MGVDLAGTGLVWWGAHHGIYGFLGVASALVGPVWWMVVVVWPGREPPGG
jgi:hypothetical protein